MFKVHSLWLAILAIPTMTSLCACSAQHAAAAGTAQAGRATGASHQTFSLNTPVEVIAANKNGKVVLERDLPGLMNNPKYPLFKGMSLHQLAAMSGGRLTKKKLAKVQNDLAGVSNKKPAKH